MTHSQSCRRYSLLVLLAIAFAPVATSAQVWWSQWALNPQHTGQVSVAGQPMNSIQASIVYDPLVTDEMSANSGELLAHYQVPLIDSSNVYMEFKSGTYNKNRYANEIWGESAFQWQNGQLRKVWSFTSDSTAPGSQADFWEPVFHGVLANGFIYVPGSGGTLFKLNTQTGAVVSRVNPFGSLDRPAMALAPGTNSSIRRVLPQCARWNSTRIWPKPTHH